MISEPKNLRPMSEAATTGPTKWIALWYRADPIGWTPLEEVA